MTATIQSLEAAVDLLSDNTTDLLDVSVGLKDDVAQDIANAVAASENAAIPVMYNMTGNQINMATIVLNLINGPV